MVFFHNCHKTIKHTDFVIYKMGSRGMRGGSKYSFLILNEKSDNKNINGTPFWC